MSGETVTFKEGQLALVFNARKRGQKGKALEKKWLLLLRKILRIEGKTALLEGMKGKSTILNLKHVPEGLCKEDFHTEHGSITRDIEHNDTEDARLTKDIVHNDTEHPSPTRNIEYAENDEKCVPDDVSCTGEEMTYHPSNSTNLAARNVLGEKERDTIQISREFFKDEDELAIINNGSSSTIIRCIDEHSGEDSILNPADVTNSIFLTVEDSMLTL